MKIKSRTLGKSTDCGLVIGAPVLKRKVVAESLAELALCCNTLYNISLISIGRLTVLLAPVIR